MDLSRYTEDSETTAPSQPEDPPASNSTRIARLEGKVDLLARDVRAVLKTATSSSKKLAVVRGLGVAAVGALTALAPEHAAKIGKAVSDFFAAFGGAL